MQVPHFGAISAEQLKPGFAFRSNQPGSTDADSIWVVTRPQNKTIKALTQKLKEQTPKGKYLESKKEIHERAPRAHGMLTEATPADSVTYTAQRYVKAGEGAYVKAGSRSISPVTVKAGESNADYDAVNVLKTRKQLIDLTV